MLCSYPGMKTSTQNNSLLRNIPYLANAIQLYTRNAWVQLSHEQPLWCCPTWIKQEKEGDHHFIYISMVKPKTDLR